MRSTTLTRAGDGLYAAGAAVAVVLLLPILVVGLFFARLALFVAAAGAVAAGLLAFATSGRFREWLRYAGEELVPYKGMGLATDVSLGPGHVWARLSGTDACVGADDLMQAALGPVDRVDLPAVGRHVEAGEPLFRLHRAGRSLSGRSPLSGTVVAVNPHLGAEPGRVNAVPFGGGWTVRLAADDMRRERHGLRRGVAARELFRREVDRLLGVVAASQGVPAMADGGEVVGQIHEHIDDDTWKRLQRAIFDEPAAPDAA